MGGREKIPIFGFDGEVNAYEWVEKLNKEFEYTRVRNDFNKTQIAIQFMEGPAHVWATRWQEKHLGQ